jgi:hypothetical protein
VLVCDEYSSSDEPAGITAVTLPITSNVLVAPMGFGSKNFTVIGFSYLCANGLYLILNGTFDIKVWHTSILSFLRNGTKTRISSLLHMPFLDSILTTSYFNVICP